MGYSSVNYKLESVLFRRFLQLVVMIGCGLRQGSVEFWVAEAV
jgi:hypothetical protein